MTAGNTGAPGAALRGKRPLGVYIYRRVLRIYARSKEMKKICALIMCVTMCGAALFAQTVANEADFETKAEGGGVVITEYKGQGGDVVIPATIGGKAVVGIGDEAFQFSSVLSVTIPAGVTSIGERVFEYSDRLASITVSAENRQYKDIEGALFTKDGKTLLTYPVGNGKTAYTIPAGVTGIGNRAFSHCTSLTSVTIPAGVTDISDDAFNYCKSLVSITIPASVASIGNRAFYNCSGLTSATIPEGLTSIGDYAFYECESLLSITLPASVTSVGYGAFYGCDKLKPEMSADIEKRFGERVFFEGR
jgi:hypothetical protein